MNWDGAAENFINMSEGGLAGYDPPGFLAIFIWRGEWRPGSVQFLPCAHLALASHVSYEVPYPFIEAMRRLRPAMPEIVIAPRVKLKGNYSVRGGLATDMNRAQLHWLTTRSYIVLATNERPR